MKIAKTGSEVIMWVLIFPINFVQKLKNGRDSSVLISWTGWGEYLLQSLSFHAVAFYLFLQKQNSNEKVCIVLR